MKMWEDLLKGQDMLRGYEIVVFLETAEVTQIVQEIFEHNQVAFPFEMSVLLSDRKILEDVFKSVEGAIQWLNGMDVQKLAIRIELFHGTMLLVEQEELKHERKILLKESENILDTVLNEVCRLTEGHLAVYTVEGVIFGEKEELGFLLEIDKIPHSFIQAESIKVKIFFAQSKEVLSLYFSYKEETPNL